MIKISVPATCANIGPGFDVFGMALDFYNYIWIDEGDGFSLDIEGEGRALLPKDKTNLMIKSLSSVYKGNIDKLSVRFQNNIPLARGLGSSATAIVGGLFAGNELSGRPYSKEELLNMAIEIEGHPDNVTPAVLGGFTLSYRMGNEIRSVKIVPPDFDIYLVIPNYELETEKMRKALPDTYKREDVVFNVAHASLVTIAFLNGDFSLLKEALSDRIHEPYRGKYIKGYFKLRERVLKNNEGVCVISGSGPTISCFSEREDMKNRLEIYMDELGMEARVVKTRPSTEGVKVEKII